MSTDLVTYDKNTQKELMGLLGIKGTDAHIQLLFKVAEHYQLDVLTKEIALIPNKGPFIGVWGRLHIAHRSGRLDGLELDDEWEDDQFFKVRCVVWRNDKRHPAAKVIGRVAKREGKEWPYEIARARALRAALGFAFSIHDAYDQADSDDEWDATPDERVAADGTVVLTTDEREEGTTPPTTDGYADPATGEVFGSSPANETEVVVAGPTGPAPPDEKPATIVVGGHSLAQKIAIAARKAGIEEDDDRHDVIRAATHGAYNRGTDIAEDQADSDEVRRIFDAFAGLADGTVYLKYDPGGEPRLYRTKGQ